MSERERVAHGLERYLVEEIDDWNKGWNAAVEVLAKDAALSAMGRPKLPARVVEAVEMHGRHLKTFVHTSEYVEFEKAAAALRATHIIVEDKGDEGS